MEGRIETGLKKVFTQIEELDKSTSWYSVLDKIYDTYTQKFTGEHWYYWKKGDYLPKSCDYLPCIICNQEPNCIEKPEPILSTFTWTGQKEKKKKKQKNKDI